MRYSRQTRLPEIGEAGQRRLCAAAVQLSARTEHAREIEGRYLRAAGACVTGVVPGTMAASLEPLGLCHVAAREVAEGALAALVTIKSVLEGDAD